jgi:predicted RNase H-like nuclease (RuvC/YqgF family)
MTLFTVHDAIEQAEADHAKSDQVRMARDVATMFDELRALGDKHAELHADRARLGAEVERIRDERARQDAGLWRKEADRERARIVNMQADPEHTEREIARLQAELEQARRPWWRKFLRRSRHGER